MIYIYFLFFFIILAFSYLFKLFINKTDNLKKSSKIYQNILIISYILSNLYFIFLIILYFNLDYIQENIFPYFIFIFIYCSFLYYILPFLLISNFTNSNIFISIILYICYLLFSFILFNKINKNNLEGKINFYFNIKFLIQFISYESALIGGIIHAWETIEIISEFIYLYLIKLKIINFNYFKKENNNINKIIEDKKRKIKKNKNNLKIKKELIKLENNKKNLKVILNIINEKYYLKITFFEFLFNFIYFAQSIFFIYDSFKNLNQSNYESYNESDNLNEINLINSTLNFFSIKFSIYLINIFEKITTFLLFLNYLYESNDSIEEFINNIDVIFNYLLYKNKNNNNIKTIILSIILPLFYFTNLQFFIDLIQDLSYKNIVINYFFNQFDFGKWNKIYDLIFIKFCFFFFLKKIYYFIQIFIIKNMN